jgi:hypothetical protein
MLNPLRSSSCAETSRCFVLNCSIVIALPFQCSKPYHPQLGVQCQGSARCATKTTKTKTTPTSMAAAANRGKDKQKAIEASLEKVEKQHVKSPKRSAEMLKDAAQRTREYSRLCMRDLRHFQRDQKLRTKLRYGLPLHVIATGTQCMFGYALPSFL